MGSSIADSDINAQEINHLWSKIYSLWKERNKLHNVSDNECNKYIDIFSQLLDLIDKEANSHDYYFVLRKRAQHYCLTMEFDDALKDLCAERDFARESYDLPRLKECDELISQVSACCIETL